ncbi:nucleotidyltransferase family protein [Brucella sp. H1_1004]|uniref:nucleotidyltransferase family protein n=1 Tax=Brucella sp. H1_1004 TaxID=3110109 RepID=UPI0039B4C979
MSFSEQQYVEQIKRNEANRWLLEVLPIMKLPQATLTAGCLFQTVWNLKSGNEPNWAIKDYDVFYFDAEDISWEAEDAQIEKLENCWAILQIKLKSGTKLVSISGISKDSVPLVRNSSELKTELIDT